MTDSRSATMQIWQDSSSARGFGPRTISETVLFLRPETVERGKPQDINTDYSVFFVLLTYDGRTKETKELRVVRTLLLHHRHHHQNQHHQRTLMNNWTFSGHRFHQSIDCSTMTYTKKKKEYFFQKQSLCFFVRSLRCFHTSFLPQTQIIQQCAAGADPHRFQEKRCMYAIIPWSWQPTAPHKHLKTNKYARIYSLHRRPSPAQKTQRNRTPIPASKNKKKTRSPIKTTLLSKHSRQRVFGVNVGSTSESCRHPFCSNTDPCVARWRFQ